MTVTVTPSVAPKLDPKTEVGVRIIRLPSRAALAESLGCDPSAAAVKALAATLAGPAQLTDIVVFDHQPWHKVLDELKAHPQVHIDYPETILEISFSRKERAVWWSTEPFTITSVRPSPHHAASAAAPNNPFDGPPEPYVATPMPGTVVTVYAVRAMPIVQKAVGHMYKISFEMGEDIDPDMSCTP
jgi:hypothetical protein